LLEKLKNISCFIFDVDGVLTNGEVMVMPNGVLVRKMNIKDGYAIQLAVKKGYSVWIISGGNSVEVEERLRKLGVTEVYMGVRDKSALVKQLVSAHNKVLDHILYMGDDMPDYEAMQLVGIAACPNDAADDIKSIATYIALAKGGLGCAREIIEKVLKLNDHWDVVDHIPAR
jgi:3-deoxy-D-manno-octulosonate 8-phosphate phosphatase (KDO 8-P phosphatase)